jgi:hypothetical protein
MIPKVRPEGSGTTDDVSRKAKIGGEPSGARIKMALGDRDIPWLVRESGLSDSTVRDAIRRGPSRTEVAFKIATALGIGLEWLLTGKSAERRANLISADDADWVDVEEYDLRELTDESRGPIISTSPFRKDWLNRTLGVSYGLWIAKLPADLPARDLREGDPVFLRDVQPGEAQDGATYIVRASGFLTVVRLDGLQDVGMPSIESNLADRRLAFRNIGYEEGKATLVARVLGVPFKRL